MREATYNILFIALLLSMVVFGCKKPYLPPIVANSPSYLVVEGVINPGTDSTIIRLSRTIPLSTKDAPTPELGAKVVVESDANARYPLTETGKGNYVAVGLNLSITNKYRLTITTADSKTYQSDFVQVKNSQPIDSVTYQVKSDGVQINANTHDPSNSTRYYRWDYSEAWIIHSKYQTILKLQTDPVDSVVSRPQSEYNYKCFNFAQSSHIVLASTANLASDVLQNTPITKVASTSERFTERYSILVKQYALTKEAFDYFDQLRKNTEELGSIFDAQPSTLTGNIHCISNPSEPVIGYIAAGIPAQKRIYINTDQLPLGPAWNPKTPYGDCEFDTLWYTNPKTKVHDVVVYIYSGLDMPIDRLQRIGEAHPYAYTGSSAFCVDCTLRGVSKPPPFWTDK
jgi:hypothetical protein